MRTFIDVDLVLERNGVIATREHPQLRGAINRRIRNGQLVRVLPGVYSPPTAAPEFRQRVAAVPLWDPDAILTHEAAAALTFWPDIRVAVIRCAVKHEKAPQRGYAFVRERIPPELVWRRGPVLLTNPTLTALDVAADTDGGSIDRALLKRKTTLDLMREALVLTARRRGNADRRRMLLDSRDDPWSTAERQCHRLLREAGITGWKGNQLVTMEQQEFFVDIMFRRLRLVVEIDGREFHIGPEVFESDRKRQNLLVLHGWRVLRVTWAMITDEPDLVIALVREAIAQSAAA